MLPSDPGGGGGASPFTPPPGNPGAIHASATTLRSKGTDLGDLGSNIRRRGDSTTADASWTGDAQAGYATVVTAASGLAAGLEIPATTLAGVVSTYADALDTAQKAIARAATAYDSAQTKAQHTADTVNNDPNRTQAQVDAANTTIQGYQSDMDSATNDAVAAWATFRTARDKAVHDAADCCTTLEKGEEGSGFKGFLEQLKKGNERFHSIWDLGPGDYALGKKLEEAIHALPGVQQGAQEARAAQEALSTRISVLKALQETGNASEANLTELSQLEKTFATDSSALSDLSRGARNLSMFTRGMTGLKFGLGGTAIVGDIFTMISPEDSGAMGWVDRAAAGTNAALVGTDLAMTAGVFGAEATIPVAGEVLMAGTAAYLAGDYLYHHWKPFHDACNWVGNTTVSIVKDVGHVASDVGHDIAKGAEDAWDAATSWL